MNELFIRIIRKKLSYQYKNDMNTKDDWYVNDKNNMLDDFHFYVDEAVIFSAKVQTVANIPNGRHTDTIIPGPFQIKCFIGEGEHADPRNFYGRIHGIINTYDMDGQKISEGSTEPIPGKNGAPEDFTRWLVHDLQKHKPNPPNIDTRVAWSAGCFIMSTYNLKALGDILDAYKIIPGDIIGGELMEEE